jgi:nucleoside-specific outer membrane channel protein Tsx
MNKKLALFAAATLVSTGLASHHAYAWGIDWQDTYVSYRHLWQNKDPGYRGNMNEDAVNISYANGWTYGSNFVNLDIEQFGHQDPANTVTGNATDDSMELYAVFRTVLSGNKISGTKAFAFGPFDDVGFEMGLDLDTQNDQYASYKRMIVLGPQFSVAMPKGYWTLSAHLSHEWDTDAYLPNGNGTNYDIAPEFETAWMYPFAIGPESFQFTGYMNVIGPKGRGATGDDKHVTEILAHPKILMDIGKALGYQENKIWGGVGYEYWHNKFGNSPKNIDGTEQNAWFVEVGYQF